jgi:hypothetical protein
MDTKMRHVGKIANTDQRCVIAFMQIPNRVDHALVIPTDSLPPRYEQAVMDVLKSAEGQNEECFAVALSRRLMPDTGKDIFATLHDSSLLLAVPCARILMMPMPNQPVKLTDILVSLGRLRADDVYAQTEKFNPHINNIRAGDNEQKRGLANALLMEAKMLETEAHKKREMAFTHVPSLRPVTPTKLGNQPTDTIALNDGQIHDPSQLSLDSLLKE